MSEGQMQLTVSHRIPIALAVWVAEQAERRGITKSAVLRMALEAAQRADTNEKQEAA
jgi:hypothetical protein